MAGSRFPSKTKSFTRKPMIRFHISEFTPIYKMISETSWQTILVISLLNYWYGSLVALDNGLALTPPMGWLTWERFRCNIDCDTFPDTCISENLIKRTARAMAKNGYLDAGYQYVILDDCWSEKQRDNQTGELVADLKRFPSGIKKLVKYVHKLGLKFGIYHDYGTKTCGGYPGLFGYEEIDALSFARWKVDYVKMDGCNADTKTMDEGYPRFGKLMNDTDHPMVFSCSWPVYVEYSGTLANYPWIRKHCNLWRNWNDINDNFESVKSIMNFFAKNQERLQPNAGQGHWNDPDMLIIGNFGLSLDQCRTQMSIWAVLAAPLIMSTDLDTIKDEFKAVLLNKNVIAVNQDALSIQGKLIKVVQNIQIWTRPLLASNSSVTNFAVAFVNLQDDGAPFKLTTDLSQIQLNHLAGYTVKDLYADEDTTPFVGQSGNFSVIINPTGCQFFRFTAV